MKRENVEDILLAMNIPAGVKGFIYIPDAIEILGERGDDVSFTRDLYPSIAKNRKTTPSSVERGIRHALDIARGQRGNHDAANKYIGFTYTANSHSLKHLYTMLKREEEE